MAAKRETIIETDGDFFDMMKQIERDVLTNLGDTEALKLLDQWEKEAAEEADEEDETA